MQDRCKIAQTIAEIEAIPQMITCYFSYFEEFPKFSFGGGPPGFLRFLSGRLFRFHLPWFIHQLTPCFSYSRLKKYGKCDKGWFGFPWFPPSRMCATTHFFQKQICIISYLKKNALGVDFLKCSSAWCVWGTSACERAINYPVSKRNHVHPIFVVFIFPVMSCGSCGPGFAGACSPRFSASSSAGRGCLWFEKLAIKQSHCCCMLILMYVVYYVCLGQQGLGKERKSWGITEVKWYLQYKSYHQADCHLWSAAVSKTNLDVIFLLCHALSCCKSLPSPANHRCKCICILAIAVIVSNAPSFGSCHTSTWASFFNADTWGYPFSQPLPATPINQLSEAFREELASVRGFGGALTALRGRHTLAVFHRRVLGACALMNAGGRWKIFLSQQAWVHGTVGQSVCLLWFFEQLKEGKEGRKGREGKEGRTEGRKEGKEGKEGKGREGRKEGGKEGRKEGREGSAGNSKQRETFGS